MSNNVQLPLGLPTNIGRGAEDLIVSPVNKDAVSFINSWPDWPVPIVILAGPVGAGKSHLASVWASMAEAIQLPASDQLTLPAQAGANVVVEDIGAGNFNETALFHLINEVRAHGGNLLLTSRTWPGNWGMQLPDLTSRMKLARLIELNEPDDELLQGVMAKLFADLQIEVDGPVIEYMVLRMERSLASAQQLVTTLDSLSMAQKRAITKPLAAQALRQLGMQE